MVELNYDEFMEFLLPLPVKDTTGGSVPGNQPWKSRCVLRFGHAGPGWPTESVAIPIDKILEALDTLDKELLDEGEEFCTEEKRQHLESLVGPVLSWPDTFKAVYREAVRKRIKRLEAASQNRKEGLRRRRLDSNVRNLNGIGGDWYGKMPVPFLFIDGIPNKKNPRKNDYYVFFIFTDNVVKAFFPKWKKTTDKKEKGQEPHKSLRGELAETLRELSTSPSDLQIAGMLEKAAAKAAHKSTVSKKHPIRRNKGAHSSSREKPWGIPPLTYKPVERRDKLEELKAKVLSEVAPLTSGEPSSPSRHICLHGMPGAGKTVLAVALCNDSDVRKTFKGKIVWVTLGKGLGESQLSEKQGEIARGLRLKPFRQPSSVDANRGELNSLLEQTKCLLVFDDAWEEKDVESICTPGPHGIILVTTQKKELVFELNAASFPLLLPDKETAWQILRYWSKCASEDLPPAAKAVAKECGNLPLALAMCGSLARKGMSWEKLNDILKNANLRAIAQRMPQYKEFPNLLKVLQASVDDIPREGIDYLARFLDLAIFPEDTHIPVSVVQRVWIKAGLLPEEAEVVILELEGRSLIEYYRDEEAISLHDLFLDYCRGRPKAEIAVAHGRLVDSYWEEITHQTSHPITEPQRWADGPKDDGYFFKNIARHMLGCSRHLDCVDLLINSPKWMLAQRDVCGSDASFRSDVMRAMSSIPEDDSPANLMALTKLWTAKMVTEHSEHLSDEILEVMARLGQTKDALAIVRSREDSLSTLTSLIKIYSVVANDPPRTLLNAVADLERRLNLRVKPDVSINLLISTGEILGRCGFKGASECLLSRAKGDIERLNHLFTETCHLPDFALTYYRLNESALGHAMLVEARKRLDAIDPHSDFCPHFLRAVLKPALEYNDPLQEHFLAKLRDLRNTILKDDDYLFQYYLPLSDTIMRYDPEEARRLLKVIYTTAKKVRLRRMFPPFWLSFLRHYLMLPNPSVARIESVIARVSSESSSDSVSALSRASIWLGLAGESDKATKHAEKAAAYYNEHILARSIHFYCAPERAEALTWLGASFRYLGRMDISEGYLASMRDEVALEQDDSRRLGAIAKCARILIEANLVDQACHIVNDLEPLFCATRRGSDLYDSRVAVPHCLTRIGRLDEAFNLLGWSKAVTNERAIALIELSAALLDRGDCGDRERVDKTQTEFARIIGTSNSFQHLSALTMRTLSTLLEAGFEEDALQLGRRTGHECGVAEVHLRIALMAMSERRHEKAKKHLRAAVRAIDELEHEMNIPRDWQSTRACMIPGLDDPEDLPLELLDLFTQAADVVARCDRSRNSQTLLNQVGVIFERNHKQINAEEGIIHEQVWRSVEFGEEESHVLTQLRHDPKRKKVEAYTRLGVEAARKDPRRAEKFWDEAWKCTLECERDDKVETMLLLTRAMSGVVRHDKVVRLLCDAHRVISECQVGSYWTNIIAVGFRVQEKYDLALRCRMDLIQQYVQLGLLAEARKAFQEIPPGICLSGGGEEHLIEMVKAIVRCNQYRLALEVLSSTTPNLALATCISVVLPAIERCQKGLSVEILMETANICAWVRPEWKEVTAVLTSSPSASAAD